MLEHAVTLRDEYSTVFTARLARGYAERDNCHGKSSACLSVRIALLCCTD